MEDPFKIIANVPQQEVSDALWTRVSAKVDRVRMSRAIHPMAWRWALSLVLALGLNIGVLFLQGRHHRHTETWASNIQYHLFHWCIYE